MTKTKKLDALKSATDIISKQKQFEETGMCIEVARSAYDDSWEFDRVKKDFPELMKYKPAVTASPEFWFERNQDGAASRVAILLCTINDIENAD